MTTAPLTFAMPQASGPFLKDKHAGHIKSTSEGFLVGAPAGQARP